MITPSIQLDLGNSKFLSFIFIFLHGGAALMLIWSIYYWLTPNILIFGLMLAVGIGISLWYNLVLHARKTHPKAVKALIYLPLEQVWLLVFVNAKPEKFVLLSDSVLFFGLGLLKFKRGDHFLNKSVLICQDGIQQKQFKDLRRWWKLYEKTNKLL